MIFVLVSLHRCRARFWTNPQHHNKVTISFAFVYKDKSLKKGLDNKLFFSLSGHDWHICISFRLLLSSQLNTYFSRLIFYRHFHTFAVSSKEIMLHNDFWSEHCWSLCLFVRCIKDIDGRIVGNPALWYFFLCRSLVVVPPDEEEKSLLVKLLGPLLATLVRIKGKWITPI